MLPSVAKGLVKVVNFHIVTTDVILPQHRVSKAVFRQHSLRELGVQMLFPASHLMIYDGVFNNLHFGDA